MSNAASSINVLTERDQVMPPNSGYRCSRTVLVFTNVIPVLSGTWPTMRGTSATRVDAKVFNGNEVLFHWAFPGYRLLRTAYDGWNRPSIVIAVSVGWKVSVISFEMAAGSMRSDHKDLWWQRTTAGAHASCELPLARQRTAMATMLIASSSGTGMQIIRRIDLKAGRTSVSGTGLSVSHISGPALIKTIQACRQQCARVEGPDHVHRPALGCHRSMMQLLSGGIGPRDQEIGRFSHSTERIKLFCIKFFKVSLSSLCGQSGRAD